MANQGEIIRDTGLTRSSTYTFTGADSLCYWSNTTYLYISCWAFSIQMNGNYALVTPGYKVWLEKWNGTAWEELAYMYVKNNKKTFFVNTTIAPTTDNIAERKDFSGKGYIYRIKMQPWEGSYREYLGATLCCHGIGAATNYSSDIKGHKVGWKGKPGYVLYEKLIQTDEVPSSYDIYNPTLCRGSLITSASSVNQPYNFIPVD